jgi:hypothetical protein
MQTPLHPFNVQANPLLNEDEKKRVLWTTLCVPLNLYAETPSPNVLGVRTLKEVKRLNKVIRVGT